MDKKTQLTVMLENKPGALAHLTGVLSAAKVNLEAIAINDGVHHGVAKLVPEDAGAAAKALKKAGIPYHEQKVYAFALPNAPGVLAEMCSKLAAAGINIHYLYGSVCPCGEECHCDCTMIVSLEDGKAARAVLEDAPKKDKKGKKGKAKK